MEEKCDSSAKKCDGEKHKHYFHKEKQQEIWPTYSLSSKYKLVFYKLQTCTSTANCNKTVHGTHLHS